jgi:hypothetical protein
MIAKQFERFLNKPCTILTRDIGFPFTGPIQHSQYFSGLVKEVNQYGVLIEHLQTKTLAFFAFPIVGIVEEQTVTKDNPNYEKIKEELEQKKKPTPKPVPAQRPTPNNYLSVEEMTKMAKQIKEKQK